MEVPICGPAYQHESVDINYQRCLNMYPVYAGPNGRGSATESSQNKLVLKPTPGHLLLNDDGDPLVPCRGWWKVFDNFYGVWGSSVQKIVYDSTFKEIVSRTEIGTLGTTSGIVRMDNDKLQLCFVDNSSSRYVYILSSGAFNTHTNPNSLSFSDVVFSGGTFFFSVTDSDTMYASNLNAPDTINGANITAAQAFGDKLRGMAINKGELWALGTDSIEIYENTAEPSGFPWSLKQGAVQRIGCKSINTVQNINDNLIFLDSRGYVVRTRASDYLINTSSTYQLEILSTDAQHAEWSTYTDSANAIALAYTDKGHLKYQISWPADGKTWVRDLSVENAWHELNYFNSLTQQTTTHLSDFAAQVDGQILTTSQKNNNIYLLTHDTRTDDGEAVVRQRVFGPMYYERQRTELKELVLGITTGDYPLTGQGSDPHVIMKYSSDSGHTWSRPLVRSLGGQGDFDKVINWQDCGDGRGWVVDITITDPIDFTIYGAWVPDPAILEAY